MTKKLGLLGMLFVAAVGLFQPATASAQEVYRHGYALRSVYEHRDWRADRWRERREREWREHRRWEHPYRYWGR